MPRVRGEVIERCLELYWHRQFNELTIDHPMRMAAVFAYVADVVTPDEPDPDDAEDYPYERGWWGCNSLVRKHLLNEVDAVVGPLLSTSTQQEPMANPCDPVIQQQRQDFLDWLYDCSGRHEAGDCTYTGLYQEFLQKEAARLNEEPCH